MKKGTHTLTCPDRPSEPRLPFYIDGEVMKIFTAKNFSLFCTVFNTLVAISLVSDGHYTYGAICGILAAMCANNYRRG